MNRFARLMTLLVAPAGCSAILGLSDITIDSSATFNNPNDADPNDIVNRATIQTHVIQLIDGTARGATIRISTTIFASASYRDALRAAHARGVDVQLLADSLHTHYTSGTTFFDLANDLGQDVLQPSFAALCPVGTGCIGSGTNHGRFILFSSTSGRSNVIVQTSANMFDHITEGNTGLTSWNNAVTLVDEPALYEAYVARFTAMRDKLTSTAYSATKGTNATVYFFPKPAADPTSSTDNTILGILDNVDCAGANTTGGYGEDHLTSIRVAMLELSDVTIAKKLRALDDAGCVVHVVHTNYGTSDDAAMSELGTCDAHDGVTIDTIHYRVGDDSDANAAEAVGFVNSQYLLIDGYYSGLPNQQLLWTGSYNYNVSALRYDDGALLQISNHDDIISAFQENFQTLAGQTYCTTQAGTCPTQDLSCK